MIETVDLPEFGLSVSWAMCRNPMCANFGIHFEGEIPEGRKQVSDDRYYVRLSKGLRGRTVGEMQCRYCGQSSRLASNEAIRPIARYFLSLSLPFADCPNTDCSNHGVNLFEHWGGCRVLPAAIGAHGRLRPLRNLDRSRNGSARSERPPDQVRVGDRAPRGAQRTVDRQRGRRLRNRQRQILQVARSYRRPPAGLPRHSERASVARRRCFRPGQAHRWHCQVN